MSDVMDASIESAGAAAYPDGPVSGTGRRPDHGGYFDPPRRRETALEYSLKKREADQKAELEKQKADYELRLKGLELQLAEAQGQQKLRLQAQEAAQEAAIKQRAMQDKAAADVAAHRQQAVVSAAKLAESNCNAGCAKPTSRRQRRNGASPKVMRLATCPTF
jgi:hypothetical protein